MALIRKYRQALGLSGERNPALDNQQRFLDPFLKITLLNGLQLTGIALVSGKDNLVSHKLGRAYSGYVVTDRNGNAVVWTSTTTNNAKSATLILQCSANVTVSLWVY